MILFGLILLTTPAGSPIWVASEHIKTIQEAREVHCPRHAAAIVRFDHGNALCVMEMPSEVVSKIGGAVR
jgi:hypothetical protein